MKFPVASPARFNESVTVEIDEDNDIKVEIGYKHVYLDPEHARRLAKTLKKAARKAEKARAEAARW